jgi:hypothetical protein
MTRIRIVLGLGGLLIAVALGIGLWPVHPKINITCDLMGPCGPGKYTYSCGSPLLKQKPVLVIDGKVIRTAKDECAFIRDHRRRYVKLLGIPGAALLAAGLAFELRERRGRRVEGSVA